MTDREKAIVMAYTGIAMFEGDKLDVFYEYIAEIYGRPVYSHEMASLNIMEKSKPDFLKLCDKHEEEKETGTWIEHADENGATFECSACHEISGWCYNFCPNCGNDKRGDEE